MVKTKKIDNILLICVLLLIALGLLMVFSVSASSSQELFGNSYYFLKHQIIFGFLPGIILGFICFKAKISNLKKIAPILFFINLILLLLVFMPGIGIDRGGAQRWIGIGSIAFQPSELLKITLILYISSWLANKKKNDLLSLGCFWGILAPMAVILILQPDFSTLLLLAIVSWILYFSADTPVFHTIISLIAGSSLMLFLVTIAPYRMRRFLVFIKPELDPMGMGYQIKQALIAIGSGGLFGKGLGMSKQKFGFIPNPMSDAIFTIFCEETGFIGPLILILLFMIFLIRGLKISAGLKDNFSKFLCAGLSLQIVLQAFFNMASLSAILPLTGTPLPFISYGGSHIMVELISVGILLNISKQ